MVKLVEGFGNKMGGMPRVRASSMCVSCPRFLRASCHAPCQPRAHPTPLHNAPGSSSRMHTSRLASRAPICVRRCVRACGLTCRAARRCGSGYYTAPEIYWRSSGDSYGLKASVKHGPGTPRTERSAALPRPSLGVALMWQGNAMSTCAYPCALRPRGRRVVGGRRSIRHALRFCALEPTEHPQAMEAHSAAQVPAGSVDGRQPRCNQSPAQCAATPPPPFLSRGPASPAPSPLLRPRPTPVALLPRNARRHTARHHSRRHAHRRSCPTALRRRGAAPSVV